jgi:hypothetical protein
LYNFCTDVIDRIGGELRDYDVRLAAQLGDTLKGTDLIDIFRQTRGVERGYTLWRGGKGVSRIDRVYMDGALVGKVTAVNFHPVPFQAEGHRIVEVEVREALERGPGYWKLNTSLLKDSAYAELIRETWAEVREEKGDFGDVGQWWDYAKSLVRTVSVDHARRVRRGEWWVNWREREGQTEGRSGGWLWITVGTRGVGMGDG